MPYGEHWNKMKIVPRKVIEHPAVPNNIQKREEKQTKKEKTILKAEKGRKEMITKKTEEIEPARNEL